MIFSSFYFSSVLYEAFHRAAIQLMGLELGQPPSLVASSPTELPTLLITP